MQSVAERPTVVVVDDDPAVRKYVRTVLQHQRFEVLEAADGVDACELLKQFPWDIQLLITDIEMPRMDGIALGQKVNAERPKTPVLYISGFTEQAPAELKESNFLPKPFTPAALVRVVQNLCRRAGTP